MKSQPASIDDCWAPKLLAGACLLGIVVFHLAYAGTGFSHYRDQHLGTALVYAREGIDLLRPMIVGFNANNAPTPQEFPLWQAAASLPLRWFGEWFGWANIVSLLFFATALYPVFKLGEALGDKNVGWWAVALLLAQPPDLGPSGRSRDRWTILRRGRLDFLLRLPRAVRRRMVVDRRHGGHRRACRHPKTAFHDGSRNWLGPASAVAVSS